MQIMQNAEHFVISTRVSARETNNIYKYIKGWKCNFNSRLRKETNYHAGSISRNVDHISIHVSARRRTNDAVGHIARFLISIHVSVRRRTCMCSRSTNCFSISTRVSARRRTRFEKPSKSEKLISIHVSARKLTSCVIGYLQLGSIFQLTSPQGDEHKSLVAVLINQLNFNSRLRKETNTPLPLHKS